MTNTKPHARRTYWILFFGMILVLDAIDLITKAAAQRFLPGKPKILLKDVFELFYLENHGAAFGILENQQWFFFLLTLLVFALILYLYARIPESRFYLPLRILAILLSAGALGNLIDRILYGYVRDFFYFKLINFPVFNVADIYVTVAAGCLVILLLTIYRNDEFSFLKKES